MADIKPTTVPSKTLSASITAAASTFKLDNILGWNGSDLTSADFGSVAYAAFRNSAGTLLELIEFDPSTIASASITINKRGLKFDGTDLTTEVAANKLAWVKGETIVELGTHHPQLLGHYVDTLAAQTIGGAKTFSVAPDSDVAAISANELVRKTELDAAALGSITNAPVVVPGNAGETVTIDQLVYLDAADQEWKLADADTAGTVENVQLGITRGSGVDGGAIANGVTIFGEHEAGSAIFTAGKMFASNTAGGFATSTGTNEVSLGIAISTTKIDFTPRYDQQITEPQQDALVGNNTDIAVGTGNKYVTQTGLQDGAEVYAADAGSNDTYVITLSPVPAALETGMVIQFKANTINTGACTLNVNSLGAKSIKKQNDQDPVDGDIEAGQIVTVVYDGTNFQMQSQVAKDLPFSKFLDSNFSAVSVTDTTTETQLYQLSIAAGVLGTANVIRVKMNITDFDIASGNPSVTIRLKYGATTLIAAAMGGVAITDSKGWMEFKLFANASTSAQQGDYEAFATPDGSVTTGIITTRREQGTATEDSTGALNLTITAQWSGTSTGSITTDNVLVELIQA